MIRLRSALAIAAGAVAGAFVLFLLPQLGVAHAQVAAGAPVTPARFDGASALTLVAVVLGGLGTVLGGASAILHAIAPRTKTTVDDKLVADVDAAHAKLDQVLGLLRAIAPGVTSVASLTPAPVAASAKPAQAGFARIGVLLCLGAIGAALALGGSGCASSTATSRQSTLTAAVAVANTGLKALETYDKTAGDAIVAASTDQTRGLVDLQALRARVAVARKVVIAALDSIGIANGLNDDASLAGVARAINDATTAVTNLTAGGK